MQPIFLNNTLTRKKTLLTPLDADNIGMYVCGPTVYDRAHLGNARSVVVYDVLYRVLLAVYGKGHVTYVRNITDVDDKINNRAKDEGVTIQALTEKVTGWFHDDMNALGCLAPTYEPRATKHIAEMIAMIENLLSRGHAYEAEKHILFDVTSAPHYGQLSGRKLEDLQDGARVQVAHYKKNAGDFVLWKPADSDDDPSAVFESPWGKGRPGWHIECSAMSMKYLGKTFDIHGGGADLMFPHHENEIAQSCCSGEDIGFAKHWVHNGFLTVAGEKMSKSLGNFITVRDLLDKGVKGEVIRLALLTTKYNEPLDFTDKLVSDAQKTLDGWYRKLPSPSGRGAGGEGSSENTDNGESPHPPTYMSALVPEGEGTCPEGEGLLEALADDLNVPKAISIMHSAQGEELYAMGQLLGLFTMSADAWFKGESEHSTGLNEADIEAAIVERKQAKENKDYARSDAIRDELIAQNVLLEDKPGGVTQWRRS